MKYESNSPEQKRKEMKSQSNRVDETRAPGYGNKKLEGPDRPST